MTTASQSAAGGRPFTGRHMLIVVIAFFGVIIAANLTLAYFAGSTWTGLIVRNGYVASQEYNQVLADARKQAAAGYSAELIERPGGFALDLRHGDGSPLTGLAVQARIGRPAHEGLDRTVNLQPATGEDIYVAHHDFDTGTWVVAVTARDGETIVYRKNYRVSVAGPVR